MTAFISVVYCLVDDLESRADDTIWLIAIEQVGNEVATNNQWHEKMVSRPILRVGEQVTNVANISTGRAPDTIRMAVYYRQQFQIPPLRAMDYLVKRWRVQCETAGGLVAQFVADE